MNARSEILYLPEDPAIKLAGRKRYRKGWLERKELDSNVVIEALNESNNFMEITRMKLTIVGLDRY